MFVSHARVVVLLWLALACQFCWGQEASATLENASTAAGDDAASQADDDLAAIRAAVQAYVDAFNKRDVEQLVALWSPEGVYHSRQGGEALTGHDALREAFTANFAEESVPTVAVDSASIEFVSPNVAVERGTATVTHAEEDSYQTEYSAVYVKRDGKWLIDRIAEDEIVEPPSNYSQLQDLEWLIGEWESVGEDGGIEFDCQWAKNQNFISRRFKVMRGDEVQMSGLEIIGWDPHKEVIRSWLFDSDGAFVEGTWTKLADHWSVQAVATLADGGIGSYTGIVRPLDETSFSFQKINQVIDSQILPHMDEVTIQRK